MSAYIPVDLRRRIMEREQGRCAYCLSAVELMGVTFEIDHIIPQATGGQTDLNNLCLACPICNRHKSARLTALDPESGQEVDLFHPLQDSWSGHFTWANNGANLVGLTPTGRATIAALDMNRPGIVRVRRYWIALKLHPPEL